MGYKFILFVLEIIVIGTAQQPQPQPQQQQQNVIKKIYTPRSYVYNVVVKNGKEEMIFRGVARLPGEDHNPKGMTKCTPVKKTFSIRPMTCKDMQYLPQLNCPNYCGKRVKVAGTNKVVSKLYTCRDDEVEEVDIYCDGKVAMAYKKVKSCKCSESKLQFSGR